MVIVTEKWSWGTYFVPARVPEIEALIMFYTGHRHCQLEHFWSESDDRATGICLVKQLCKHWIDLLNPIPGKVFIILNPVSCVVLWILLHKNNRMIWCCQHVPNSVVIVIQSSPLKKSPLQSNRYILFQFRRDVHVFLGSFCKMMLRIASRSSTDSSKLYFHSPTVISADHTAVSPGRTGEASRWSCAGC